MCEAKTYEEYLGTVDICATVEEYQAAVKSVTTSPATPEPETVGGSSKHRRPPEMPAERGPKPIKEIATLGDWLSNKYTIISWDKPILERTDVMWVVILYSGIGGFPGSEAFRRDCLRRSTDTTLYRRSSRGGH